MHAGSIYITTVSPTRKTVGSYMHHSVGSYVSKK